MNAVASRSVRPPVEAGKVPDERTIRRIIRDFRLTTESEQQSYDIVQWPQSFTDGRLPWEASRVILDLLRFRKERGMLPPLISDAVAFWRITQAGPDLPVETRIKLAHTFQLINGPSATPSQHEAFKSASEYLQWYLAFQPARSEEDNRAYQQLPEELRQHQMIYYASSTAEGIHSLADMYDLAHHDHEKEMDRSAQERLPVTDQKPPKKKTKRGKHAR